ncbi:MAG: AI-2E family transporter [Hyphomicrobiales bacterium]|nr:AI-2E family transporter [Hyphomicrobiales bacterium]MCY4053402.1 AI-2E family transporter [Hyphomicrobiales bacterium]
MEANWKQLLALIWFAALILGGTLLIFGRDVLLPFFVAVLLWYFIDATATAIGNLHLAERTLPRWLCRTLSLVGIASALYAVGALAGASIADVYDAAPLYKNNIEKFSTRLSESLGIENKLDITSLLRDIDFVPYLQDLALGLANIAGVAMLVALYVIFLLIEQYSFSAKIKAIFPNQPARKKVEMLLSQMQNRLGTYIWIKTLMSLLTAVASYVVLLLVGVDYAEFWALLIFLLNYIPTIGSLLATTFPTLLALVQFDSFTPGAFVLAGCGVIQFFVGNILEPRIAGDRLNISPLVVLLSLAVWGSIWGIAGMFLAVPITVMLVIVLAHFPATRPIAILLSSEGQVDIPEPKQES